jgi:hypothetical protein
MRMNIDIVGLRELIPDRRLSTSIALKLHEQIRFAFASGGRDVLGIY